MTVETTSASTKDKPSGTGKVLLEVRDLAVEFRTEDGTFKAVRGVDFDLRAGETLGIVGESGSGKSVTNLAMLGLIPQPPGKITSGSAMYNGKDLLKMSDKELASIRGNRIAMIFQDPMTTLNPFLTIDEQLTEVTRKHLGLSYKDALDRAIEMLEKVGIPGAKRRVFNYPHEFSGGMRQRVVIAMALSCDPEILIADEPTTALDVTIQAQILELMQQLQEEHNTAIVMITHDLGVIANMATDVLVMYAGRKVEQAKAHDLFADPRHPYTLGLLNSIPRIDEEVGAQLSPVAGQPPDMSEPIPGCSFYPRCPYRVDDCQKIDPPLVQVDTGTAHACIRDVTQIDLPVPPTATN
ncbi:ABC transporter ATP-binding protein [Bremerella sp. P1]|uniref:ABC transporter ATP-binding protein n=1 Tax=Bremerella sp. P1 TaxID=3026424 RepID=UPI0023674782|nr:ABC transporter ATP-binding protein [Bremerella sp. P1]WDI40444.1 ABC transporter ATP-binding protein [Bremerella sp. P1]